MIWKKGDIWFWHKLGNYIVVPTNAGYRSDGANVMGAGIAKEAATRFSELPYKYGEYCKKMSPHTVFDSWRLICVPSKRINLNHPYLSWKNDADYKYVEEGLTWLDTNVSLIKSVGTQGKQIYVPLIGAGNGGLDPHEIKHMMDNILQDKIFIGVEK